MNKDHIIIATWNANGILQRRHELEVFLQTEKIDICLLSETHLTKHMYTKIRGYATYQTPHPQDAARGGSAILIKDNITHYEESKYATEYLQATTIKIKTSKHQYSISAIYSPPRHGIEVEDYLDFLRSFDGRFIIGGDFNAKNIRWGSRLTTAKGRRLHEAATRMGCSYYSTGRPTYWPTDPNKIPDLIDFFITKNISENYVKLEDNYDMSSDHSPVIMTLSGHIITKEKRPTLVNKFTNWDQFKTDLELRIKLDVPLQTERQLDEEAEKLIINIQQAAWMNTIEIQRKVIGNNYPKEICNLIKQKRKIRKKWQQTRSPADKTALNTITQQIKREIKEIKNETFQSYLSELTADSDTEYSLWKATKGLKKSIAQIPPIRDEEGVWAKSNQQKANMFAEYLERIFKPNEQETDIPMEEREIYIEEGEIALVTPREVGQELKAIFTQRRLLAST